ncbi:hypothetical protein AURDEDRAFT_175321 [Auricularia subglabra TFB-10046 SS5]|nr:hypothetical protein AURDEDRAFT_175321 [Auricularia subglabra TFB-10046 SS5]
MSSSTTKVYRDRVLADKDALARVKLRLAHVRCAQIETLAQLLDVRRAAAALAGEVGELESTEQALASGIAQRQAFLLRAFVTHVPDDVWRFIFEEAVCRTAPTLAWTIASVSTHWRTIALSAPRLWDRLVLRDSGAGDSSHAFMVKQHEAVKLMLSRSGACSLNIRILWLNAPNDNDLVLRSMRDVLATLSSQAHRWGAMHMVIPGGVGRGALAALKGPTPRLDVLHIMVLPSDLWPSNIELGYLPSAPRLQSLTLHDAAMSCSVFSAFPALRHASLEASGRRNSTLQILEFISRAGESLDKVEISAWTDRPLHALAPILMPRLLSLRIADNLPGPPGAPDSIPSVTLFITPRLTHLTLGLNATLPAPASFLTAVSSTVKALTISDNLTADSLDSLRHLESVARLGFGLLSGGFIDESAYTALVESNPPIWPRLETIDLGHSSETCGDGLLRLIACRNFAPEGDADPGPTRPCPLRAVTLGPNAPLWVRAEVQRLFSL